jgi:hypothetical protein
MSIISMNTSVVSTSMEDSSSVPIDFDGQIDVDVSNKSNDVCGPHITDKILCSWNLFYHLPNDKNWDTASYKIIGSQMDTVEKVVSINEFIPENIVRFCMLFIMRVGISPMWEDPKNRDGGCFSFKVINKQVPGIWKQLFYALCGETLMIHKKHSEYVNGITISPKKKFCIIKIWMKSCILQDPNMIIHIELLSKQGCLFKKHSPEF